LSTEYRLSRRAEKVSFLSHMRGLKPPAGASWLILEDFKLIYKARDKNNRNLKINLMRRFRRAIDFCGLKELSLHKRKYTLSNEHRRPTLVRLDRLFCNQNWDLAFEGHSLDALSSSHSDHCPLLLTSQLGPQRSAPFMFENFWTHLPNFHAVVTKVWNTPTEHVEPFHRLGHKLHITFRALKAWSKSMLSDAWLKVHMAQEVILRLDEAQDFRDLSQAEFFLRPKLEK
jgi:hypothetical protein